MAKRDATGIDLEIFVITSHGIWPAMTQDEIQGWMLRVSPLREPTRVLGQWEEYYDEDTLRYFYFNRSTYQATYDSSVVGVS